MQSTQLFSPKVQTAISDLHPTEQNKADKSAFER